jgi:hypothetical protein
VVVLSDTPPWACWLVTIEAVGLGLRIYPLCLVSREEAEASAAALAALLDLDLPVRPTWSVNAYTTWHYHQVPVGPYLQSRGP